VFLPVTEGFLLLKQFRLKNPMFLVLQQQLASITCGAASVWNPLCISVGEVIVDSDCGL